MRRQKLVWTNTLVPHGADGFADVFGRCPFGGDLVFALPGRNRPALKELCDRRGDEPCQLCIAVAIAQPVLPMVIPKGKKDVEPIPGPRTGDIEEPAFLFDLFGVTGGEVRW